MLFRSMANDLDQKIVLSAISDAASSLLEFLPSLGMGECIVFGDGVTLPVRMRFDRLEDKYLPRSSTAKFTESWRETIGDDKEFLENVVRRWRAAGTPTANTTGDKKIAEAVLMPSDAVSNAPIMTPAAQDNPAPQMQAPVPTMVVPQSAEPEAPVLDTPDFEEVAPEAEMSKGPIASAMEEKERIREALRSKSRFFK